ncbi:MAG: Gfo/Idh/MocA family oxidoreductase, partial [Treponema sp.]|nr:Gfo/Idh/MocA family oxidoreductase [Treponema sp.]
MIHIAIIGVGNISRFHTEAYLTFPDRCKIVALCDIVVEKCENRKKAYNLDAKVFDSHKTML